MPSDLSFNRRSLMITLPLLAAASQIGGSYPANAFIGELFGRYGPLSRYGPRPRERFPIPAVALEKIKPGYLMSVVPYVGPEEPGTLVVRTSERYLYHVGDRGQAVRYGVGVGREGLAWRGLAYVGRKAAWPRWTPTDAMIAREPKRYARWAGGMAPGLDNPLGARALYLYRDGGDTMYRIHGTNEPWSVGTFVSSGCIRMINQDVIELFDRVPVGTRVLVAG